MARYRTAFPKVPQCSSRLWAHGQFQPRPTLPAAPVPGGRCPICSSDPNHFPLRRETGMRSQARRRLRTTGALDGGHVETACPEEDGRPAVSPLPWPVLHAPTSHPRCLHSRLGHRGEKASCLCSSRCHGHRDNAIGSAGKWYSWVLDTLTSPAHSPIHSFPPQTHAEC